MVKCAIYCRVSSDEQAEKGTIGSQIDYSKRYLELHGSELGITDSKLYLDEGVSGTIPLEKREAGLRLLNDAKLGKFQILFVYRLDRLARSVKHVLDTYEALEKKSIALKSMTEAFDTGSPTGKFFMTLLASIAALERDTILDRTLMGKERNAKAGKWVAGAPPFGYRIGEDGFLQIYDSEAEIVRLVFKLYMEGMSTIEVAKYLNAKQIMTPSVSKGTKGKSTGKWHAGHVSIILRSSAYAGTYDYLKRSKRKKETIMVNSPLIVSIEEFESTQQRIINNSDVARGSRGRKYLLRGHIYCANCGRAMAGSSGGSKSGRVYYRCSGTLDQGQGKKCDAKMVRAVAIEKAVWEDINNLLLNPEQFNGYVEKALNRNKEISGPVDNELAEIEQRISEKQTARATIISMIRRGVISDNEAESSLKDLAQETDSLVSRREFLFSKKDNVILLESEAISAQTMIKVFKDNLHTLDDNGKAKLIQILVRRIDITTLIDDLGKKSVRANMQYKINRSVELEISGNAQSHTMVCDIESTWVFKAFSRKDGVRIGWN